MFEVGDIVKIETVGRFGRIALVADEFNDNDYFMIEAFHGKPKLPFAYERQIRYATPSEIAQLRMEGYA